MSEPTDIPPPPATPEALDDAHDFAEADRLLSGLSGLAATPGRKDRPERLKLGEITLLPVMFNVRCEESLAEHHLTTLSKLLKSTEDLAPVTVRVVGSRFILIDGHHRHEAYRRSPDRRDIPVRYFEGSPEEAVLAAARANTRAVLPMDNRQRQDLAWRLTLYRRYSKRQIAEASGVSHAQVAIMRKVMKALGEQAHEFTRWWQARRAADGKCDEDMTEEDREMWIEEQAQAYADRLAKEFSTKLARNPEIAARALEHYFGRKLPDLLRELLDRTGEVQDDDEEDEF
ncbi:ParB N-terminal domain-containing protein [Stappia indica]|uniref:ParB N-terminal domain-containing protein n=1 Tax=Stappia indica TaxID=538381 RepID=UPI00082B3C95|nr:ParB/RepB/Spo0J family partition protein [Stappia indica]